VIVATGSILHIPAIKGINGPNVMTLEELTCGNKEVGKKAVVLGGSHIGCEMALYLKERGAEEVTIIEESDDILRDFILAANVVMKIRDMLEENKVNIITGANVKEVFDDGLEYEKEGTIIKLACDSIVIATRFMPNNELGMALEGKLKGLTIIGDALFPRKILMAVHEGFHAVRFFE